MKKSKFRPQQIVQILKEWESGKTIEELACQNGVSTATIYSWGKGFSGMEANDLERLRALEEENAQLKRMYVELALDHEVAKEIIAKKL